MAHQRHGSVATIASQFRVDVSRHVVRDAAKATASEQSMTLLQGLRLYPKAIGWSVLLSTAIVMDGFDLVIVNSLFGLPAFQERFGNLMSDGTYLIPASWQSGLPLAVLVGQIIGLFAGGVVAERYGYRKAMILALVFVSGFIFVQFFAQSLAMLLVGSMLCAIPWGAFQIITTTYAAEVCPLALRPYMTSYVNLCWVMGQLLSSGVLRAVSSRTDHWAYRIPYALQWMWPPLLILGVLCAPESPWWLVRQDRLLDAKKQLLRLTTTTTPDFDADHTINMIVYANELEKSQSSGTSYLDCFRGVDRRRTEIVCLVWVLQSCFGSTLLNYSTFFYEQAGLATSNAFTLSIVQFALGAIGTILSWGLMARYGRRTLYFGGELVMIAILLIIGFLGIPQGVSGADWAIGSMLVVYVFIYDATLGPVCYCLVSELSSTRLRNKSMVIARTAFSLCGIVVNVLTPRMLNPGAWHWGAKSGFFWAGVCVLCAVDVFPPAGA